MHLKNCDDLMMTQTTYMYMDDEHQHHYLCLLFSDQFTSSAASITSGRRVSVYSNFSSSRGFLKAQLDDLEQVNSR